MSFSFSGLNGSKEPFALPVVYTLLSIPNLLIASWNPNEADMTPIDPTTEDLSANISSPEQASQYPPEAATSSIKTRTGISFFSAKYLTLW